MGISEGSGGVDCSVGTIVWVRRRNGSWWPGRILGENELSASHLMSPRSGTPVKLLGREDASVDWYNLEKSKRVKAFRCGEFDDCIERAESAQGIPIKKREKYARREDAILHALELEKQLLEKRQQKLGVASPIRKIPGAPKKEAAENLGSDHAKPGVLKIQDESIGHPSFVQKVRQGKQPNWEDDNSEAIPRMRGLQDFGLRIVPSKRKHSISEGPCKITSVNHQDNGLPSSSHSMGGFNYISNIKNSLAIKRKRSQGGLTEESIVKRRDRRRPLVQVLQSSVKLQVPHALQSDGTTGPVSVQGEKEQTGLTCGAKRSRYVYVPGDSNECFDHIDFIPDQIHTSPTLFGMDNCQIHPGSLTEENDSLGSMDDDDDDDDEWDYLNPGMDDGTTVLADATQTLMAEPRNSGRYVSSGGYHVQGHQGSMSSEEPSETALNGHMPHFQSHDYGAVAADVGVSKWQSKGKRNLRNLSKKPMEVMDGKSHYGSIQETYIERKGTNFNQKALDQGLYHRNEELDYISDEDDLIEDSLRSQMVGFDRRKYPLTLKSASKEPGRINTDIADSEEDLIWRASGLSHSTLRGYWEEPDECLDPLYAGHRLHNGMDLVDVDLKVQTQTSYQGEHVPLVSLMSKLNGKAIIGHPIQIEVLENGSSDLLPTNDDFGEELFGNDGNTALPPVWRTARRTAMHRVPRPKLSAALVDDEAGNEAAALGPPLDHGNKSLYKKPYLGYLSHKARLVKKSCSQIRRPPPITEKKSPKKLLKKVSLSSQKIRTLSSIPIEQKHHSKGLNLKFASKNNLDGLINPEETGPTTVTCIPVKLVFSRLLEAVGRPPSRAANYGVLMNGNPERKPL
ncbi:PREDICTED: uncharacterized protein At1g51745 [Nelumbo nucifera]|uniref:Uncharacterized protein At1g51745 n=2 Tax=Nelumbo nucifera TaxID=4432 RepID=A0A1U8BBL5_NELNU|nr:PREDICTED: uncharacterized protein At1g51745 [Nelumbo nucifera]DAD36490.1 TPA_asm: hypothetical protein HUJ06_007131 [Nelumbo nucifera]